MGITFNNFENFLDFSCGSIDSIDWVEPVFIGPLKAYREDGNKVEISNSYIDSMLTMPYKEGKSYTPIEHITSSSREAIDSTAMHLAATVMQRFSNLNSEDKNDMRKYLFYLFVEMMNNVVDHSSSVVGGYAMAQSYKNGRVQFVVADRGIGFLENVKLKEPTINNEADAIIKAIEKGFTATRPKMYGHERNAGFGLYAMTKIIEETGGRYVIVSNDMLIRKSAGMPIIVKKLDYPYKGAIVCFDFYEDKVNYSYEDMMRILWIDDEDGFY